MHEFAIAKDIINTIKTNYSENYSSLAAINILSGNFSSTVIDSLQLGLETILKEEKLENVVIRISEVKAKVVCECGCKYELNDVFDLCPECSSYTRTFISGDGVMIDTIEFNQEEKKII
jgi:Zn finger protein HypA/HybF involved in hydrogenase expression